MLSFTNRVALFFGWKPASAQHNTLPTIMRQPAAKIAAAVKQPEPAHLAANAAAAHSTVINITNDSATDTTSTTADSADAATTRSSWWAWLMSLIARLGMRLRLVFSPNTKACPPATATVTVPITTTTNGPTSNGPTLSATNTQRSRSAHSKVTAKATATPTMLDKPAKTSSTTVAKADSGVDVAEPTYPAKIAAKLVDAKSRTLLLNGAQVDAADDGSIIITVKDKLTIKFDAKNVIRCLQRNVTGKHVQLEIKAKPTSVSLTKDYAIAREVARAAVASAMLATKTQRAATKAARIKAKKANPFLHDSDIDTEDDESDDDQDDDFSTCTVILRASQALQTCDASGVKALLSVYTAVFKKRAAVCDVSGQDSFEWFGM
ncbi:hypothetical protein BC831DRAFT_438085 [Entophlyctis helioformis]|nr:hypothetical protein BC831DRAFT_438085 [Entophlyctis helioformis]